MLDEIFAIAEHAGLVPNTLLQAPEGPNPNGKSQGGKRDTDAAHSWKGGAGGQSLHKRDRLTSIAPLS